MDHFTEINVWSLLSLSEDLLLTTKSPGILDIGLVSHELTANLYIFNQFKLNELWSYQNGCKLDNFELHNSLKVSFRNI